MMARRRRNEGHEASDVHGYGPAPACLRARLDHGRQPPGKLPAGWIVALALVVAACGGGSEASPTSDVVVAPTSAPETDGATAGYQRTPAPVVADLAFLDYSEDPNGVPYSPVASDGHLLLVYFGYLSCPDVCPLTLSDIRRALDMLPPDQAARVETAMVTVDPERDSGEAIAAYLDVFTERNRALVAPDTAALEAAGERFSAVWRIPEHEEGETYWVDHSAVLYVVDDTGSVVWEFPYRTEAGPMATTLESLFAEAGG